PPYKVLGGSLPPGGYRGTSGSRPGRLGDRSAKRGLKPPRRPPGRLTHSLVAPRSAKSGTPLAGRTRSPRLGLPIASYGVPFYRLSFRLRRLINDGVYFGESRADGSNQHRFHNITINRYGREVYGMGIRGNLWIARRPLDLRLYHPEAAQVSEYPTVYVFF